MSKEVRGEGCAQCWNALLAVASLLDLMVVLTTNLWDIFCLYFTTETRANCMGYCQLLMICSISQLSCFHVMAINGFKSLCPYFLIETCQMLSTPYITHISTFSRSAHAANVGGGYWSVVCWNCDTRHSLQRIHSTLEMTLGDILGGHLISVCLSPFWNWHRSDLPGLLSSAYNLLDF